MNIAESHPDSTPAASAAPAATEHAGTATPRSPIPAVHVAAVLLGFPAIFWIYSQALLHRDVLSIPGVDFFITFWTGATLLYAAKIGIIARVLAHSGWTFREIGYGLTRRGTARLVAGYAAAALALFAFVELSLTQVALDPAKLAALPGLYPDTTVKRLVFLVMAFAAGLSEEITYRGFAIRALEALRIHRWLAVPIAAIPFVFQHGLKSLDQFWWFLGWGLVLGALFVATRRLLPGIIIHWMIILTAMLGVFAAMQ
ncbi:MAG: CPBP family intramembrane metalloprotease [Gemmatimonadetes bacterium]|nr:CPBP family intramembrane metalloprotease [Gemmatimonadota bacterium]